MADIPQCCLQDIAGNEMATIHDLLHSATVSAKDKSFTRSTRVQSIQNVPGLVPFAYILRCLLCIHNMSYRIYYKVESLKTMIIMNNL